MVSMLGLWAMHAGWPLGKLPLPSFLHDWPLPRLIKSSTERVSTRMPATIGRPVRAGNYHQITVRVPDPALPMIGAPITRGRIPMPRKHNLRAHLGGTLYGRVKIVNLKPQ